MPSIETITGDLRAIKELLPNSLLHADELVKERRSNPELRGRWFYTGDGPIYYLDKDKSVLAMTRVECNPVLNNIDDAFDQLVTNGNYRVSDEDFDRALSDERTLVYPLLDLDLTVHDSEFSYFEISTSPRKYNKLNRMQELLAMRVHGGGPDFVQSMELLNEKNISLTRIYVLNPDYVKKQAESMKKHTKKGALGRASRLLSFNGDSSFDASVWVVDDSNRLRGIRRDALAVGEPQIIDSSFKEMLNYSLPFIPDSRREEYVIGLKQLFKK